MTTIETNVPILRKRIIFIDPIDWDYDTSTPYKRPLGGTQSALCYFASELGKYHYVYIINNSKERKVVKNVIMIPFSRKNDLDLIELKRIDPDYIITISAPQFSVLLKQRMPNLKAKHICWYHHDVDQPMSRFFMGKDREKDVLTIDKYMMVSNWQMRTYHKVFGIPMDRMVVVKNCISPCFENAFPQIIKGDSMYDPNFSLLKYKKPIMVYTSTPFRGLDLLVKIFPKMRAANPELELHIYSSMKVYQSEDSVQLKALYEKARNTDGIVYSESIGQAELAEKLKEALIFCYPSTFRETFCISLAEAGSQGAYPIVNSIGAILEVTQGFGTLIDMEDRVDDALNDFATETNQIMRRWRANCPDLETELRCMIETFNSSYSWFERAKQLAL